MKKVISLVLTVLIVLGCVPALAKNETADFAYIIENGKAYVTGYTADSSEVSIPSEIDGYTVVGIVETAFANRDDITKVTIPDTVTYLGSRAFFKCTSLEEIVIPSSVSSLYGNTFVECRNLKKVIIGEGVADIESETFLDCRIETLVVLSENTKFQSLERVEFYSKGVLKWYYRFPSFYRTYIVEMFAPSESLAQKYAKEMNIKFVPLEECEKDTSIEVEPKIQGIHGGIIDRAYLADRITKIAESMGCTVTVSGDNIAVQKDGKSMAIVCDTAYYMENGKMVTESIFENAYYVKIPEKALESVLGEDSRKSEKYKEFFRKHNSEIYRIEGTIETAYGTLAVVHTNGIMHGFTNSLHFIKWDGEDIRVSAKAPYKNPWSPARWEKIELSQDGKLLTITYPQNKKIIEYYYTYGSDKTVLWDEGTYVITANLETGDVKRVIKPLKDENVDEPQEKPIEEPLETKPAKTIDQDGMKVSVSILSEPQNGPDNMFDDDYISYCVLYVKDETRPEYMEFDLGEIKNIEKLGLAFRDAKTRTTYFDVRVSEDGINYETVIEKRGSDGDTNEFQYFDINKKARYVRVYGYSNTYNRYWVSVTEARVITN